MTYKQLVNVFQSLADGNLEIEMLQVGETLERSQPDNIQYPLMFLEHPQVTALKVLETYNIVFYILDKSLEDNSNIVDVLSRTKQIVESVFWGFENYYPNFIPEESSWNMIPFTDETPDVCHGWRVEIPIENIINYSVCEVIYENMTVVPTGKIDC